MQTEIILYLYGLSNNSWFGARAVESFSNGLELILIAGLILFSLLHKDKFIGFYNTAVVIIGAVFAYGITSLIKYFYVAPRPFVEISEIIPLATFGGLYTSFPSGHSTFFMALAVGLYFYNKKLAFLYGVSAVLIGVSRVASGVHWPVDIFAGFVIGGICVVFTYFILNMSVAKGVIKKPYPNRIQKI